MADTYFGVYGAVVDGNDAGEGVLKVRIPAVYPAGEVLEARPCLPYGVLFLPEAGDKVWVAFEGGDPVLPLWMGLRQTGDAWPTDPATPTARMLRSHTDHRLVLDDDKPEVAIRFGGKKHVLTFTDSTVTLAHDAGHAVTIEQAKITITVPGGASVALEKSGATVSVGGSSVKLEAASVTVQASAAVTVKAETVLLGNASPKGPVVRAGLDQGIGNLGAPVIMIPGQFSVLA